MCKDWGPEEGEAQLGAERKMPNSSGVWGVWVSLINFVRWHSVYETGNHEDG